MSRQDGIIQMMDGENPVYPRTKAEAVFLDGDTTKTVDAELSQLALKVDNINSAPFDSNFIFDNFLDIQQSEYDECVREIDDGVAMYAAQQATVEALKDAGTVIAGGRCGDALRWELNSNRSVRIYGSGRMYDYLKGTNVGKNKEQITNTIFQTPFMYYYSWHITPLRYAIEGLEKDGYQSSDYKGEATASTSPAAGKGFYLVRPVTEDVSFTNFLTALNTPAEITAGNHLTILKRDTGETYWTQEDVTLDIDEGIVYDERTVHFTGDGAKTVFNYADKLNVINSVLIDGVALTTGFTYDPVTGNLTFTTAPANGADIECEFAQYVNPWYIYRIEKSFHRYVWENGDTEVYTIKRNPNIATDKAYFDSTFAGDGYEITSKGEGSTPATIVVEGVTYTYSRFIEGYCPRDHYLSFNPNEDTYNTFTIEDGITYVGDWGFYRNSGIVILLPEGVTEIGIWCIRYSDYTRAVRFPSTLEKIGWYGCSRMTALEYIQFQGNSLIFCDDECFHNCIALKGLILPSSLTYIGKAFAYGNRKMKILDLGSADEIGALAVQNSYALRVFRAGAVETIGSAAIQNSDIRVFFIPSSLSSVENGAFTGCVNMKTLLVDSSAIAENISALTDYGNLFLNATKIYLKKSLTANFIRACFAYTGSCNGYDRLVKWGYEQTPGTKAGGLMERYSGNGTDGVHWLLYETQTAGKYKLVISGYNGVGTFKGYPWEEFVSKGDLVEVEITDTTNGSSVFMVTSGYSNIKKMSVKGGVIFADFHLATAGSPDLTMTELNIDGVTSIGNNAFAYNNGLTKIVIPDSVINVGDGAFRNIGVPLILGKNVKVIGNSAFYNVNHLSLDQDNAIESIENSAFFYWGGTGMSKLYLPKIKTMGTAFPRFYGAANGCTDIYIGNQLTEIGVNCFSGLSGLANRVCNIHIAARQEDVTVGTGAFGAGATVTWEDPWMEE